MSIEIFKLGFEFSDSAIYILAGLFGGFFSFLFDIIQRQQQPVQEKIDLNCEFFVVKAFIIPFGSLIITLLAVYGDNVNTWPAALYLGVSFPVLVTKAIGSSNKTIASLSSGQ